MNLQRWIARREPDWQEAKQLLEWVETQGLGSLSGTQIQRLASLYRSLCADLSRAKTFNVGPTLLSELQQLTTRAYNQIYQGSRHQEWQGIIAFYRWQFPLVVQQTWGYTAIALGVFSLGGLIAWWYSWQDPSFLALVVPEGLIHQVRDKGQLWMGSILGNEPLASSGIMVNNMTVAFRMVGGAITAGLFTLYALFTNGLLLGAIAALVSQNHLAFPFWAFVFPHGALELPAIFLAGGAGLLIAQGLVLPGNYRRLDALKQRGYQAAQLVFGIVPLLFIAGLIEGFISPNPMFPEPLRYGLGIAFLIVLGLYCSQRR
ncbi:MAG: stage II sporulation protein M [Microcystaceae cyanobacterium]